MEVKFCMNNLAGLKMDVQTFTNTSLLSMFLSHSRSDSKLCYEILRLRESLVPTYQVKAEYKGAMSVKGVCAKVYQEAEINQAIYSIKNPKSIWYSGEDLFLELLFERKDKALNFQTFLNMWHINNPIVVATGVVYVVEVLENVFVYLSELKYVKLAHYDGEESLEQYTRLPMPPPVN